MSEDVEPYHNSETCPKCKGNRVLHSDWTEFDMIFLRYYCQDCNFSWREKIDLTI